MTADERVNGIVTIDWMTFIIITTGIHNLIHLIMSNGEGKLFVPSKQEEVKQLLPFGRDEFFNEG